MDTAFPRAQLCAIGRSGLVKFGYGTLGRADKGLEGAVPGQVSLVDEVTQHEFVGAV